MEPQFARAGRIGSRPHHEKTPVVVGWQCSAGALSIAAVAGVQAMALLFVPGLAHAAPSFWGSTGLFMTPSAGMAPRGAWSVGANYVRKDSRPGAASFSKATVAHYLTITLLPRLELTAQLTNWEGRLGARKLSVGPSADFDLAGYDVDRMVTAHWQVRPQKGMRPAFALGVRDVFGTDQPMRAQYGVASLTLNPTGPDRPLTLFGWIVELLTSDLRPEPNEVAEILWLTADEAIAHPDAMPTNREFVTCLLNA